MILTVEVIGGIGVGLGVGVGVGTGVGLGVGEGVGEGLGVGVAVATGVGVGVGSGALIGVGVGVGVAEVPAPPPEHPGEAIAPRLMSARAASGESRGVLEFVRGVFMAVCRHCSTGHYEDADIFFMSDPTLS